MLTAARLVLLLVAASPAAAADDLWNGARVAFFGVSFIDTSADLSAAAPPAAEAARLVEVEAGIAGGLRAHGAVLVDLAPVAAELERVKNPAQCYGCEVRMAAKAGADVAVVAEVQKVSNLILTMNVVARSVPDGAVLRGYIVEMRGNTDESWSRALRYLLDHGLFPD